MRMWMVNPKRMCRKHLLGEHVELHMLLGSLQKRRSIQGFLDAGLLQPQAANQRHEALVREMEARGYKHASPLPRIKLKADQYGTVDAQTSERELRARCEECRELGDNMVKPKRVRVHCDQCEMLSINGVACHEHGCPNQGSRWDRFNECWVKQRKCFECGCTVDADDPCCSAPYEEEQ